MTSWRVAAIVPVFVLAAACSGEPATPNTVVYEVTGSGPIAWIKFITDGSTELQESNLTPPWTKTFTLPAEGTQKLQLLIRPAGEHELQASIEVNGSPLTSGASAGSDGGGTMSLSGELRGD
ncbi:hypothetical protein GCM10027445_29310 [Amycolatopsis endophytica]|uniref:Uncharacterized protein n=1 Tax=Amycolatopsis endophytica TaxID=860233 RepID=A0A853BB46_9PSEU|nr:hypothetical protein [Amycolatopsis endophytica]NYI91974.1 hypothetical protein [Amycolatopsis endophytica]